MSAKRVLYHMAYPQRLAGANRAMVRLVRNLPPEYEPVVVLTGEGMAADEFREAGVETCVRNPGPMLSRYGKAMLQWSASQTAKAAATELVPYTLRMVRFMRARNIALVHASDGRSALLVGAAARLAGRPLVTHVHGDLPFSGIGVLPLLHLSHRIVACAHAVAAGLPAAARRKTTVVHYGTEDVAEGVAPAPSLAAYRADGRVVVACIASVVPFKGHAYLLDAVAELNERGLRDRAVFVCVGDFPEEYGEYQQWLLRKKAERKLDNVVFAGWQSDPFGFYAGADLCVLPSVRSARLAMGSRVLDVRGNEGLPVSHIEAMWFGLPLVATDIGGVRELVIEGVNGTVVPPGDAGALAGALEALIRDPQLRARMGAAARPMAEQRFSLRAFVQGITDVYAGLLGTGGTRVQGEPGGEAGRG
ncbi:glycosyltransferase family 4 protein [Sphingomonas sp.]|uniref:glycosyltransferase family 4 protein n=1 Tax=Sphingomonas sp. TaxID=28214 RepID=UPI0017DFD82D|nr:glycosyltransferase family 4 protein [Sphingomonas sp.]MBA3511178.1 glycosyltransferase family 4 protein [Sphingomonas sp.]